MNHSGRTEPDELVNIPMLRDPVGRGRDRNRQRQAGPLQRHPDP